jgi:hypothetical protein
MSAPEHDAERRGRRPQSTTRTWAFAKADALPAWSRRGPPASPAGGHHLTKAGSAATLPLGIDDWPDLPAEEGNAA